MKVRATMEGFYGGSRKLPGDIFEYNVTLMSKTKEGKVILPRWVESADRPIAQPKEEPSNPSISQDKDKPVI